MSSILHALRRADQERQHSASTESLSSRLPEAGVFSDQAGGAITATHRPARYPRIAVTLLLLLLGAGAMWLTLRYVRTPIPTHAALPAPPNNMPAHNATLKGASPSAVNEHQVSERQVGERELVQPQVLDFPRLDTERITPEQLTMLLANQQDNARLARSHNMEGSDIGWDENLINAADILPTPPLPTDPVRRPRSSTVNAQELSTPAASQPRQMTREEGALKSGETLDLRGVSPELAQAFRAALQDKFVTSEPAVADGRAIQSTTQRTTQSTAPKSHAGKALPALRNLPAARRALIPALRFEVHNYASVADKRWVQLNGQRYHAGSQLSKEVKLVRIEPEHIVLAVKGQQATLAALQDWH